jgi:site-specific recombinase XerD
MPDDARFFPSYISIFNDPSRPTLAEVIKALKARTDIDPKRKSDMLSSCTRAAALIGQNPAMIPAHPRYIRDRLQRVRPAEHNISRKRLLNIKRGVIKTFELLGIVKSWSYLAPHSAGWVAIWELIEDDELRWALSRLFSMLSALQVPPSQTTRAHWALYRDALREEQEKGAIDSAARTYRRACKAWDKLIAVIPALPQFTVTEPPKRSGYTVPAEAFPKSFQRDVDLWLSRLIVREAGDDIFALGSGRTQLRPRTIDHMRSRIVQFASVVVLSRHRTIDQITCLADLADEETFKAGMRWLVKRLGKTESNLKMAQMLRSMARHHLAPAEPGKNARPKTRTRYLQELLAHERYIEKLTDLSACVGEKQKGVSAKNERRLLQFDDPALVDRFLAMPAMFAEAARKRGRHDRRAPLLMQIAVMCEILSMTPIRVSNLASLTMSRHINRTRAGDGAVHLVIPKGETKNRAEHSAEIPAESIALIDEYITDWRPELVEDASDWLFPGRKATHKKPKVISLQLPGLIREYTGLDINVHLFRGITIGIYAEEHPEDIETPTHALGHKDPNSIAYYKRLKTHAATKRFSKVILARRHRRKPDGENR